MCDRDDDALSKTENEARALGVRTLCEVVDVRDREALENFYEKASSELAVPEVVVNVVGGTFQSPFTAVSPKGRDALVRANFTWVADSIAIAAGHLQRAGRGGSIITITSIEGHRAAPGYAIYAAMKAAVTHLTRTLAVELGPARIRVNCIAPDFVPTEGMARLTSAAAPSDPARPDVPDPGDLLTIPLGRKGTPEDIGNAVLFLASEMSSYITGTTLHPDGGALAASGWMNWPQAGFTARPPHWVLSSLDQDSEYER